MPKIQLIRRDSTVIELDAGDIAFSIQRMIAIHPLPIVATRAALDMNQSVIGIKVSGILTDDESGTGGVGASMTMDLSVGMGSTLGSSWYAAVNPASFAAFRTSLTGNEIVIKSIGQVNAGLNEQITIRLLNSVVANTVATNSIINVNIAATTTTEGIANAIVSAINAASVKVNTVTTAFTSIFTVSQSAGQSTALSYSAQIGSSGTYTQEKIQIINDTTGSNGNVVTSVQSDSSTSGAGQNWANPFMVTDFTGGAASVKMSKGDKLQDLLNMITNPSPGGALINPQVLTGSLIDLPESIASIDTAQFLRISESKAVQKYVVGIRIPYESIITASSEQQTVLRQFLIPAGPGTDHSADSNTEAFDPVETVNNKPVRPNPFLRQGIAIPAVIVSFDPVYEAGDSVWTYDLALSCVEQLVGL